MEKFSGYDMNEVIHNPSLFSSMSGHNSYHDFKPDEELVFYKTDDMTRLEITRMRKRIKIHFKELAAPQSLFPYPFVHSLPAFQFISPAIIIMEEDMGNFGTASLQEDEMDTGYLKIVLQPLARLNEPVVSELFYRDEKLAFQLQDTLTTRVDAWVTS